MTEQQIAPRVDEAPPQAAPLDASLSPFLTQLMAGLGEQIKVMVSEAAAAVVAKEKGRILNEFRAQLQDEATRTLERVIVTSQEELASRALKELNETHEAVAQASYERWIKKIDQNLESAASNIQQRIDSCRREEVERVRNQAAPVFEETQAALQKLTTLQGELKVNLATMCNQFQSFLQQSADGSVTQMQQKVSDLTKQFETGVNARMATTHATVVEDSTQTLLKISQQCQQAARTQLESLVASVTEQARNVLKEKTAEISRHSLSELEACSRSHLEFISESIAGIAKKKLIQPSS